MFNHNLLAQSPGSIFLLNIPYIMSFTHRWSFVFLALSFVTIAFCASLPDLQRRGALLTAKTGSELEANGRFYLENNLWGAAGATSGAQSSQVTAVNGNSVTWQTIYTWVGGIYKVKSYANLELRVGLGASLSDIKSIPTAWKWAYSGTSADLTANVSYDMWLGNSPTATGASSTTTFEVMIWLSSRGGATPYGQVVGSASINGVTWKLYRGNIKTWVIFTYFPSREISNFSADLKPFFTYLVANQAMPANQSLVQLQAGTEPFIGQATLTSTYSVSIN